MDKASDEYKVIRNKNLDLAPPRTKKEIEIEYVKEQALDLNDKFDYIISLLMKNKKMGAHFT